MIKILLVREELHVIINRIDKNIVDKDYIKY